MVFYLKSSSKNYMTISYNINHAKVFYSGPETHL